MSATAAVPTQEELDALAEQEQARQQTLSEIMNEVAANDEPFVDTKTEGGYVKQVSYPKSPTVLNLDEWSKRRGREIAKENEHFKKASVDEDESADFFSSLFEPEPRKAKNPASKVREGFMDNLMHTPDFQEIRQITAMDDLASEIACTEFGTRYAKYRTEVAEVERQNAERAKQGKSAKKAPSPLAAAASALQNAKQQTNSMQQAMDGFGCNDGQGANGMRDANRVRNMLKKIQGSHNLRKILEMAGRFKLVAQSYQKRKITVGNDELHGTTLGSYLPRVLPAEFAYYHHPKLRKLFLSRLIENNLMSRDIRAHEQVARGPVVVVIDESGSMSGERIDTAKAMMLAMGWIARRQKRWFGVAAFSDRGQGRFAMFPSGNWDEQEMMKWLEAFIGGGTDLHVPFIQLPEFLESQKSRGCPVGKMDMILITDGIVPCPPEYVEKFTAWKKLNQTRLISIIISSDAGELAHVSDEVHHVGSIDMNGDAVAASFSI